MRNGLFIAGVISVLLLVSILPSVSFAGTAAGTYYFTESGLPSGQSWSVQIKDAGTLVTTVTGTTASLSYTLGSSVPDYYTANAVAVTKSETTIDGTYTTTFSVSGVHTMTSPTTFNFAYSNTLFYSWASTGLSSGSTFRVQWFDNMGGTYSGSVSGQQSYSNIQIGSSTTSPSQPVGAGMSFTYSVYAPSGYSASPESGSFSTTGSTTIAFSLVTYTDTFQESGLPSGTTWGIQLSTGTSYTTSTSTLSVTFNVNTQYDYTVLGIPGYTITSGSSGTLASGTTPITYAVNVNTTVFSETGLAPNTQWGVYGNNSWHYSTSNTISVSWLGTGPFNYTVQTVSNYSTPSPQTGNLTTSSNVAVAYSPITYYTYFNETGLNTGTSWSVVFNSHAFSSSTSSIRVPWNVVNSSGYTISNVDGYATPSPSTGTLNTTVTRDISFAKIAGTITYTETGLPNGTNWGMNFNGTQKYASAGSSISFSEPTGTFTSAPSTNDSHWYSPFYNNSGSNPIYIFPIALSGVPSGSGYYQQLITIDNPSNYMINSNGSNILFAAPNGTKLYAWEQSVNSSAIQVWIKNFNGSSTINMQVMPSFENLFSANGYLGEAPQLSSTYNASNNAYEVFGDGYFFAGTSSTIPFGTIGSPQYYQDNGLFINDTGRYNGLYIPTQFNNANYGLLLNAYFKDGGNTADQGATLGWSNGGTNYNGLEEFSNTIYLSSYDGTTNHLSGAIPMSVTSYNNFRFYLTANQTYTTSNVNYSGSHYSQGLGELQQYGSSSFSDIELMTSLNSLYIHYVIIYRLLPAMPTASISSYSVAVTGNATYNIQFSQYRVAVTFNATGISTSTDYYVNVSGIKHTGTYPPGITITTVNQSYMAYTYGAPSGWYVPDSAGADLTYYSNLTVILAFTQNQYSVTIVETGLPSGTGWTVYYNGKAYTSTTNTVLFVTSLSQVYFTIQGPSNYSVSPNNAWSGLISSNATINVHFAPMNEKQFTNPGYYAGIFSIVAVVLVLLSVGIFFYFAIRRKGGKD